MVRQMDDLVTGDDGGDLYRLDRNQSFLNQGLDEDISKSKEGDEVEELTHGVSLLADESVHITPGFFQVFRGQAKQAACMIYYSRKDAGTPRISPKAGNMVSLDTGGLHWGPAVRGRHQRRMRLMPLLEARASGCQWCVCHFLIGC